MAKYHINKKGNPGICRAEEGNCPLGSEGEHYPTAREAHEAYQASMGKKETAKPLKKSASKINPKMEKDRIVNELRQVDKEISRIGYKVKFHEEELEETRDLYRKATTPEEKEKAKIIAKHVQDKLTPLQKKLKPLTARQDDLSLKLLAVNKKLSKEGKKTNPPATRAQGPGHKSAYQIAAGHNGGKALLSSMENKPENYSAFQMASREDAESAKASLEKAGYMVTMAEAAEGQWLRVRPNENLEVINDSASFDWDGKDTFSAEVSSLANQRLPQFIKSAKTGEIAEMGAPVEHRDREGDITHWTLKPLDATKPWSVTVYND